ncbi:MAG: sulfate/molybdate ABC transporter ATP-binding protein [Abitibacteriaceae bacterium]|nr:sulfate/molybdate ABC transporter ATP-binding protein [Abditibacteriaceae bacterium]MBV9865191.1 sulfate/molybdate ABC transporter ATP-binding protein [Abditibacteriaceae bacterium]
MRIEVNNITKQYGAFRALDNVSLEIPSGELTALLGPSGSGKTTLLRIIAGLESADKGSVLYQDSDVTHRAIRERNVGFVFQHYALFNHMNIYENIAFGLRVRRWKDAEVKKRVVELLKLIQLEGLERRFPSQLSGGQRQRVALARALAPQPQVLLLDEPFGALDAKVRQDLRKWLRHLHDEIGMTSIFVTHDQEEAFEVADRVVVMNKGHIEQVGRPDDVFAQPANAFVMDFLGSVNVFHGRVQNGRVQLGSLEVPYPAYPHDDPRPATAYIRPHEVDVDRQPHGASSLQARVERINRTGSLVKVALLDNERNLPVDVELDHERDKELALTVNDTVYVYPKQIRVFIPENNGSPAVLDEQQGQTVQLTR